MPESWDRACAQAHCEKALQEILILNQTPPAPLPLPANNVSPPAVDVLCAIPLFQMLTK